MARLAANNPAVRTLDESVTRAKEAERLGYESVWVTQLPDARDAALVLAAYAAATQWVRLGTAVLPIYTRHPTARPRRESQAGRARHKCGPARAGRQTCVAVSANSI